MSGCESCTVRIISKPSTPEYEESYDRIFGVKEEKKDGKA